MIYLKLQAPKSENEKSNESLIKNSALNLLLRILNKILPIANPTYEKDIDKVETWVL